MKIIKGVQYDDSVNQIQIHHLVGYLEINNKVGDNYKNLSSYPTLLRVNDGKFKEYSSFSKKDLIYYQNMILNSYFFLYDKMEDAVTKSESKTHLGEIKEQIITVRKHLRYITDYINSYEDILSDYKNI